MEKGLYLYRWFRDISIARKLYFTVGTMALLIGVELFVLLFSLNTLSSLRAYVGGEGLWSKAEKDAVFHLHRYGVSRADTDYELFEQFMRVPIGDFQEIRRELMKNPPNMEVARQGFLEGRNHPDDIQGMISLFIDFGDVSYIRKAIAIWADAEAIAMQLLPIARELREQVNSPAPSQARIDRLLASIYTINEKVTALEDEFSSRLVKVPAGWRGCTQATLYNRTHCGNDRPVADRIREPRHPEGADRHNSRGQVVLDGRIECARDGIVG